MSALQTNINTLMSSNSVDELRNRLVAILTQIVTLTTDSGMFTPEVSGVTNLASISITGGVYSRSGDVVTMSFQLDVDLDPAQNSTTFQFSLPVPSNFPSPRTLFGANSSKQGLENALFEANGTTGKVTITSPSNGTSLQNMTFVVQYLVQ